MDIDVVVLHPAGAERSVALPVKTRIALLAKWDGGVPFEGIASVDEGRRVVEALGVLNVSRWGNDEMEDILFETTS